MIIKNITDKLKFNKMIKYVKRFDNDFKKCTDCIN